MVSRVMFVLPSLEGGGAQRTVVNLVNHLDRSRFDPSLVLYERAGPYLADLRDDVPVLGLDSPRFRRAILPLARTLRRERPDLLFSTMLFPNVVAVLAAGLARFRGATVIRESNHFTGAGRSRRAFADRLTARAYRRATRVVALSRGVAEDCGHRYGILPERLTIIHNPVDLPLIRRRAGEDPPERDAAFSVIGVGRLVRQKGFDLLIRAMSRLDALDWRLTLLGEGPERDGLEALVQELGLRDRVRLPGFQENPYRWIAASDLFVLSSRWEGFGHVIAEAMACGTTVLATRCRAGPDEIITDGVDGLLCPPESVDALAAGIARLAEAPELRARLARAAATSVERFSAPRITAAYEDLFDDVVER